MKKSNTETILGNIVGVASEGQGIIRYEGLVIFIPFTVTGDVIRYRITKQKKNFALGELVEIIDPSPLRSIPQCPYYGTCGGCQLQHMRYDAQLSFKRQWIEDALKKIGGFGDLHVPPIVPVQQQWSYRRRISLILRPHGKTFQAGYIATDQQTLLPITQCPIFTDARDPIIPVVQSMTNRLVPGGTEEGRATILRTGTHEYLLHFHFRKMPENAEAIFKSALKECVPITGILATSSGQTIQCGSFDISFQIDSLQFDFSPKAFVQNHPEQSLNIYRKIEELGKEHRPRRVLDLYCGIGISSCLLGKQGISVTGVEANPEAVRLAGSNAKKNRIDNVRFIASDVESVLVELLKKDKPELIIVNPPREGLSPAVVKTLSEHPAKALIYISCMPSTLARDLKHLCLDTYSLHTVSGFDMFPQTIHVETMAVIKMKLKG